MLLTEEINVCQGLVDFILFEFDLNLEGIKMGGSRVKTQPGFLTTPFNATRGHQIGQHLQQH